MNSRCEYPDLHVKEQTADMLREKTPYILVIRIKSGTTAFLDGGRKLFK
jgi:hypothetical protein